MWNKCTMNPNAIYQTQSTVCSFLLYYLFVWHRKLCCEHKIILTDSIAKHTSQQFVAFLCAGCDALDLCHKWQNSYVDDDEMDDVSWDTLQSRHCGVDVCFNFPKSSRMHTHTHTHHFYYVVVWVLVFIFAPYFNNWFNSLHVD